MQPRRITPRVKTLFASVIFAEGLILATGAFLRFWSLDLKPPHFDEGINGWFVDQMKESGFYRYDPENYHGPLYFYVLFLSLSLFGRSLVALRLPAALASLAAVWTALRFDRFFGTTTARLGALALAVSPAAVFYGRYAIHESWVVLALMITALGILGLWKEGSRRDLALTLGGITLLFLLKETVVIHLACFLLAAGSLLLWEKVIPSRPALPFSARRWSNGDLTLFCSLSLITLFFFYSGTFLNWQGIPDFFRAYAKWFQTGTGAGGHEKTGYQIGASGFLNWYWVALMARYEWPALLGLLFALRLAGSAPTLLRYLAVYAVGVLAAYSIIPYKTPWCIISILWPFCLLFGSALEEIGRRDKCHGVAFLLGMILLAGSFIQTIRLNIRHFADPREAYVYVQTMPGIALLTDPVLGMATRDQSNLAMAGQILLESYYPLPWILGDFTGIGYYGKESTPRELNGDFITALSSRQNEIEAKLVEPYLRRRYQLRDSMDECTVWFREGLFAPWFEGGAHGTVERVIPRGASQGLPDSSPKPTPGSASALSPQS